MGKGRQSLLLWIIIFCCVLPFIILPFFGFITSDDYTLAVIYRNNPFSEAQSMMYFGWAGRFCSSFLSGLFVKTGLVEHTYFIPALFLLFCTWVSIFFLLRTINSYLLAQAFPGVDILQASFILFLLSLYTMADIASGIYWFSSAIVYQSAFILFLLLAGCLIRRFYAPPSGNYLTRDGIILLLIPLIVGCNEIAAVFLLLFLLLIITLNYLYRRYVPKCLFAYFTVAFITGVIITFTSGVISVRHHLMNNNTSYWSVLPIIILRGVGVFYYILKEPVFWVSAGFLFILGIRVGADPATAGIFKNFKGKNILLPALAIMGLLVIGTLTPVLMVSKGSLPLRSLNNLIALTSFCLLAIFFITGACYSPSLSLLSVKVSSKVMLIIWGCGLLANTNYLMAWKSVFSGYFYHAAWEDRERQILTAVANHQRTVTLAPFEVILQKQIHRVFPHGIFSTVKETLEERPAAIYYYDETEAPSRIYLLYYGLDKIIVEKKP